MAGMAEGAAKKEYCCSARDCLHLHFMQPSQWQVVLQPVLLLYNTYGVLRRHSLCYSPSFAVPHMQTRHP